MTNFTFKQSQIKMNKSVRILTVHHNWPAVYIFFYFNDLELQVTTQLCNIRRSN